MFNIQKKRILLMLGLSIFITTASYAKSNVVNIYIWANYIPPSIFKIFTKETGIKVNLTEFDSNETLFTKLKTSAHSGYDLIVPSSYYVARMARKGMLHELDKNQLSNIKNLNPALLNKDFDPNNTYSLPYLWGTTGIVVNKKYIDPNSVKTWADLWKPQYKNQLLLLDDMREVFNMAFIKLGYSINDTDPKHIKAAYLQLKQLLTNVKLFNSDAIQNIYVDEDIVIGMGWNGDTRTAQQENPNLVYIYPQDGFAVWIDCLAIPKYAPHLENAHKFINFLLRPDISQAIFDFTNFSTPNVKAIKLLSKELQHDATINPDKTTLKRGQLQKEIGAAQRTYAKYWELLKIGS
jgi:spermidine/putrescine transport system substrate-binding protein